MADLSVGDKVRLTAPDLLLGDGSFAYTGDTGTVVGFKGFTEVIVSWDSGATGQCRPNDLGFVFPKTRYPK